MVGGGPGAEETGGTERDDLEITTGKGDPASIRLNANRANLTLGGGKGNAPEGDLQLRDQSGTLQIQVSVESGNRNAPNEDRVWVDGGKGKITLGDGQNDFVHVDRNAELEIGDVTGDAQARLNNTGLMLSQFTGEPGTLVVRPVVPANTRDTVRLFGNQARAAIGNSFESGTIELYRSGDASALHKTVTIDGEKAQAALGGSDRQRAIALATRHPRVGTPGDGTVFTEPRPTLHTRR